MCVLFSNVGGGWARIYGLGFEVQVIFDLQSL